MNIVLLKVIATLITVGSDMPIDKVVVQEDESDIHVVVYTTYDDKDDLRINIMLEEDEV